MIHSRELMKNPKFSVIITTYNRVTLLKKAINSVINQSYTDWELIIVNDCSTDTTKEFLDLQSNPKFKIIHNSINLYKGGARNVGIENCKGEFICFLDDDDYYLEHHLFNFKEKIEEIGNKFGIIFTQPISQDIEGNITKRNLEFYSGNNPIEYLFHHKNGIPTPRVCIPLYILKKERFNPHIKIGQDTELFMRIACKHEIFYLDTHTAVQVKHDDNSGNLKYNSGLERLNGYKYIFDNKELNKKIPKKLKNYMISYCYRRMCDHYNFIEEPSKCLKSSFWSIYYSPFDKDWKIKLVDIIYNLPYFGKKIKNSYHKIK